MKRQIFNIAPCRRATLTRLSLWSLVLPALFAVCAQAQAQNNPATGVPAVTYAGSITAPTEDSPITAAQGTIEDPDNMPTTDLGSTTWIWSQADTHGGAYTLVHPLAPTFTPLQAHVGKFLQVCVRFRDSANNDEERCLQIAAAVANVDDRPVSLNHTIRIAAGTTRYRFKAADFPFTDEDDGDAFAEAIHIESLPANGTLEYSAVTLDDSLLSLSLGRNGLGPYVAHASFPSFVYNLPGTAMPNPNYASFRYRVSTGESPTRLTQHSSNIATITFAIVPPAVRLRLRLFLEGPLR